MKFILFTIGLLWAVATAQSLGDLPECASTCATNALGSTSCSTTDISCICQNNKFIETVGACTVKACSSQADVQKALNVATSLCKSAGVTIPASEISSLTAMESTSGAPTPTSSGASATGNATISSNETSASSASPSQATSTGAASQAFALSSVAVGAAVFAFFM